MFSLLYVSCARIAPERLDDEITAIIQESIVWNMAADVTGALLFTGKRFAQRLEGPEQAVLATMARIQRDPRHTDVTIVRQGPTDRRRFANWSMAYSGQSTFAASAVERALTGSDYGVRVLTRMLEELARPSGGTPPGG